MHVPRILKRHGQSPDIEDCTKKCGKTQVEMHWKLCCCCPKFGISNRSLILSVSSCQTAPWRMQITYLTSSSIYMFPTPSRDQDSFLSSRVAQRNVVKHWSEVISFVRVKLNWITLLLKCCKKLMLAIPKFWYSEKRVCRSFTIGRVLKCFILSNGCLEDANHILQVFKYLYVSHILKIQGQFPVIEDCTKECRKVLKCGCCLVRVKFH